MREFRPQSARHISLCEALDRLLDTGVVALGQVTLSVADVDLIYLGLQLVVSSIESGRGPGSCGGLGGFGRTALAKAPEEVRVPAMPPAALGEKTGRIANAIADSSRKNNGLGQLVLTLMKLLHELLKRQALRRVAGGALSQAQVERLGVTLMNQARELERLRHDLGLAEEDLNLDLGPLGRLL